MSRPPVPPLVALVLLALPDLAQAILYVEDSGAPTNSTAVTANTALYPVLRVWWAHLTEREVNPRFLAQVALETLVVRLVLGASFLGAAPP